MKVRDLDNKWFKWTPAGSGRSDTRAKSKLHEIAREILKEKYPLITVMEEVSITLRWGQYAYLDFYIPFYKKAIEVHGEQHYKFVPHFHVSAKGFIDSKKRDSDKIEWCENNGIEIVVLPFDKIEEWGEMI